MDCISNPPAFPRHPPSICVFLSSFCLSLMLTLPPSPTPPLFPAPFSVTNITSANWPRWNFYFSLPPPFFFFLFCFNVMHIVLSFESPSSSEKRTVSCEEEITYSGEKARLRKLPRGRGVKEGATEFGAVLKRRESGTRQGQETIAAFVFRLKSMPVDCSIILILRCCYAKVGLDDAKYSWTN